MKNLIKTIICLLFISVHTISAQEYAMTNTDNEVIKSKISKKEIIKAQETNVQLRIEKRIAQIIEYPEQFIENRISGSVYAQVLFSEDYNDYSIHIIKGDKANLGKIVESTIHKINVGSYLPPNFEGKRSFVFNIDFSLDN
jgi:hypothetical protein